MVFCGDKRDPEYLHAFLNLVTALSAILGPFGIFILLPSYVIYDALQHYHGHGSIDELKKLVKQREKESRQRAGLE